MNSGENGFIFVDDQTVFETLVSSWLAKPFIAIDTEFMRTDTLYAKPGLIQIADGHEVYVIDPLLITNLAPLGDVLTDPAVVKVMHAMSEDIELLYHATGKLTQNVFDTQTAAAFLGFFFTCSSNSSTNVL